MSRKSLITLLFFFFFKSSLAMEETPEIVFSFGSHNSAPYAITHGNKIVGGIIWDIANELADELNAQATFADIPRMRQTNYLKAGRTDVLLISNPMWLKNKENLIWSKALFDEFDVLLNRADNPLTIRNQEDLHGLNIGTIRGYKYQLIEEDIAQGLITRFDVRGLDANIGKLLLNRIDALIVSSTVINYRLSKRKDADKFKISPLILSNHQVYAAISPKSSISPKKIIDALNKLKEQGVIEAIIQRYKYFN
jgi:ABC-type amino acid transport substrate-binding protein